MGLSWLALFSAGVVTAVMLKFVRGAEIDVDASKLPALQCTAEVGTCKKLPMNLHKLTVDLRVSCRELPANLRLSYVM